MPTTKSNETPAQAPHRFVTCWTDVLTPRWIRFRHLLAGNGKIHSDLAFEHMAIEAGQRVLDLGCGFGESSLEIAGKVGSDGRVVGIDCGGEFIETAEQERRERGVENVTFVAADMESHPFDAGTFDLAFARFGMMFCLGPVRALRNVATALAPGAPLHAIVWRKIEHNPAWGVAEAIAKKYLGDPGPDAANCGPGPFSWGNPETVEGMLAAAGYGQPRFIEIKADLMVGATVEEAVAYQTQVGPAGYLIRENAEEGRTAMPRIAEELTELYRGLARPDGSVWLPSASWLVTSPSPTAGG